MTATGTRWESQAQADAFNAVYREWEADSAFTRDSDQHTVRFTMWRADSSTPVVSGTISAAGAIRLDLTAGAA
jgi:hypothetical protein